MAVGGAADGEDLPFPLVGDDLAELVEAGDEFDGGGVVFLVGEGGEDAPAVIRPGEGVLTVELGELALDGDEVVDGGDAGVFQVLHGEQVLGDGEGMGGHAFTGGEGVAHFFVLGGAGETVDGQLGEKCGVHGIADFGFWIADLEEVAVGGEFAGAGGAVGVAAARAGPVIGGVEEVVGWEVGEEVVAFGDGAEVFEFGEAGDGFEFGVEVEFGGHLEVAGLVVGGEEVAVEGVGGDGVDVGFVAGG